MKVSPAQYIGGDFSIDPSLLGSSHERGGWLDENFRAPDLRFATGRYAMLAVFRRLLRDGYRVLLPDYLCEAQVHILKLNHIPFEFYRLDDQLRPDFESLRKWQDQRLAVLVINYFGFLDLDEIGESLVARIPQLRLVADCVQSPLVLPSPSVYSYTYTSLRKFLPVPDGCELYGDVDGLAADSFHRSEFVEEKLAAAAEKHRYIDGDRFDSDREKAFLGMFSMAERTLDQDSNFVQSSEISKGILSHLRRSVVSQKRRENFLFLSNELKKLGIDSPKLGVDQVPLCLPVTATNRDRLRTDLAERGIFAPVHWPVFPELPENSIGRRLAQSEIGFVIDQRYGVHDMQRQADAIGQILARHQDIKVRRLL